MTHHKEDCSVEGCLTEPVGTYLGDYYCEHCLLTNLINKNKNWEIRVGNNPPENLIAYELQQALKNKQR